MHTMLAQCGCGPDERTYMHSLGCFDCGSACCPECAISIESLTYCRACAAALLETTTVRAAATFELH
jgi:hypothetical protein